MYPFWGSLQQGSYYLGYDIRVPYFRKLPYIRDEKSFCKGSTRNPQGLEKASLRAPEGPVYTALGVGIDSKVEGPARLVADSMRRHIDVREVVNTKVG